MWLVLEQGAQPDTRYKYNIIISDCLSSRDLYNNTPLHLAIKNNAYNVVANLLQCGASVNIQGNRGQTGISFVFCIHNF